MKKLDRKQFYNERNKKIHSRFNEMNVQNLKTGYIYEVLQKEFGLSHTVLFRAIQKINKECQR